MIVTMKTNAAGPTLIPIIAGNAADLPKELAETFTKGGFARESTPKEKEKLAKRQAAMASKL